MPNGEPLIAVKEAMNIAALRKNNFSEHEDNFGFLFTLMAKLCGLRGQSDAGNNAITPYAAQFANRVKKQRSIGNL